MKTIVTIFITLLFISCGDDSTSNKTDESNKRKSSYQTLDEFGTNVFELIKLDDYEKLRRLIASKNDLAQIIDKLIVPKGKTKQQANEYFEGIFQDLEASFNQHYLRLRKEASATGIDWKKCKLEFINFTHTRSNNFESADIDIFFSIYNNIYTLRIKGCIKGKDSWLLGDRIRLVDSEY